MYKVIEVLEIVSLSTYNIYLIACRTSWSDVNIVQAVLVQPLKSNIYYLYHVKDTKCL